MGMTVIAEGVETKEQARYLCEQDITSHQGFLYSKAKHCKDVFEKAISPSLFQLALGQIEMRR